MEASAEKNSEGTSATPEKKHAHEFLIACAMMNNQIPDFWPDHPREWFFKFEAFMYLQNRDDEYKYDIAITKLKDNEAINAISRIIMKPPKTGKYEALKEVLLNVFPLPKGTRLQDSTMEQNVLLRRIEKLLIDLYKMLQPMATRGW